jgi:hypothetical protein
MIFERVYRESGLTVGLSPTQYPAAWTRDWWLRPDRAYQVASEYTKLAYYAVRGRLF